MSVNKIARRSAFLALGLGLSVLGFGLPGLGISSAAAATTSITVPYPPIQSLDPSQWNSQYLPDMGLLFEGLFGYNQKNQLEPKIAQSWKISDGGHVWTINLRHNARWSNGRPVTAQDFYYAWMRLISPQDATGAIWESVMNLVANTYSYHAGLVPSSAVGLKVLNPYSLRITLGSPADIKGYLATPASMPLYPPSVEEHPTNWFTPPYFVGDAPYIVKSFVPNGNILLTKNPRYVGHPGEFNVGNVQQIDLVPQSSAPVEDYLANKVDVAGVGDPSDYSYVLKHPALKSQLHRSPLAAISFLGFDGSAAPSPLDNQKVRDAIAMAINRNPIVRSVEDGLVGATNVIAYPGWPTNNLQHGISTNLTKARKLLAQAGYPNGRGIPTIALYTLASNPVTVPEAIEQEVKSGLNIQMKIIPLPPALYNSVTWQGPVTNIIPGYTFATGSANFNATEYEDMSVNQPLFFPGKIGTLSFMKHVATYYESSYDPRDIKLWGNPSDASLGTKFSQWAPLKKSAMADIKFLNAWTAKQPPTYRAILTGPTSESNMAIWNGLVKQFHSAKTAAGRHAAFVNAWKFVGNYSTGVGTASTGLQGQVYIDQHEPHGLYLASMNMTELVDATSQQQAVRLGANIDNYLLSQGWAIPLYYNEGFFLVKPNLRGVQANPWAYGNVYQLQYVTVK